MVLRRFRALAVLAAIAASAVAATTANADTGVIPDTPELPWSDPSHNTPLERLASEIASSIAQRPVRAYCNGQSDWEALNQRVGLDPAEVWGYVEPPKYWYPALGTYADSATHTQLSPIACERLWQFGKAALKPTKCAASRSVTDVVKAKVRYQVTIRVKVKKRVKVSGKWVTRYVWEKRRVWRTRTESREVTRVVAVDPRPCYGNAEDDVTVAAPADGWGRYSEYAFAIATLAHESVHLFAGTAGRPVPTSRQQEESRAECWGMQLIPKVATALGASPDDATAIASWYSKEIYPGRQASAPDYWSPECRTDGALDLTPGDGRWP